jgi:hypothetical protein
MDIFIKELLLDNYVLSQSLLNGGNRILKNADQQSPVDIDQYLNRFCAGKAFQTTI